MSQAPRRVVTGLDAQGKSCITIDAPVERHDPVVNLIWRTAGVPADNRGNQDAATPYDNATLHTGGTNFILTEMPPGLDGEAFMHATDTIDYLAVVSGEITLVLETEEVVLRAGDFMVDRGVIHGWRNDGEETAVYVAVTIPAKPLGKGRTI
ncbi:MAG: cupin domain-containing protein [Novosphingobium sp.]|nr:cupin domain-containing protein [Novosphingobium sp.]